MGRRLEGCWATSEGACDGHEEGKGHTAAVPEQFLHNTWAAGSTTYDNGGISRAKCVAKVGMWKSASVEVQEGVRCLLKHIGLIELLLRTKKSLPTHFPTNKNVCMYHQQCWRRSSFVSNGRAQKEGNTAVWKHHVSTSAWEELGKGHVV